MKYSVALCTYNGEQYLRDQLDSILNQTVIPSEIIVCDDGSTDKTIGILNEYKENYPSIFNVYLNETNLRSVKNFEKAIDLCTQEIIFLSDQDDIWVDNKAEKMLHFFESNPQIDVLATNGFCVDEKGGVKEKYSLWGIPRFLKELGYKLNYYELISCVGNIATGASMAFRSKIKPQILPIPSIKDYHHDEWIVTIAAQNNSFELLDEKLFYYRIHNEQQVGGVFFDKTDKEKKLILEESDIYTTPKSLNLYKRIFRRLSSLYKKGLYSDKRYRKDMLEKVYFDIKKECLSTFPIFGRGLVLLYNIEK